MTKYKFEKINEYQKLLVGDEGIPDAFLNGINSNWVNCKKDVAVVRLYRRDSSNWTELGNLLIKKFLNLSYCGLAFDGTASLKFQQQLFMHGNSIREGFCEIRNSCNVHPTNLDLRISNLTLFSLQKTKDLHLLKNLWNLITSEEINGCNMILTFYNDNVLQFFSKEEPFNTDKFLNTLSKADAWIIPTDGNIGFFLGYDANVAKLTQLE